MVYLGSKNRISKYIVPIIQSYIDENTVGYIEPFVGGANVIDKIKCDNRIGCDIHKQLIALLNKAKYDVESIHDMITEEEYNKVKNNKELYPDWYVGLVGFCAAFACKYYGGYARSKSGSPIPSRIRSLKKQNLKGIEFYNCNFLDIPTNIKGYVIYCDPPYRNTTKYSTNKFQYEEFYRWCIELSKNNTVLISEYSMPSEFECIWEKEVIVNFDSNRTTKQPRIEKLFKVI